MKKGFRAFCPPKSEQPNTHRARRLAKLGDEPSFGDIPQLQLLPPITLHVSGVEGQPSPARQHNRHQSG